METFTLRYYATGDKRNRLVKAIADYTQSEPKYNEASDEYEVDYFTIDRRGCVSFDDCADSEEIDGLINALVSKGFVAEISAHSRDTVTTLEEPEELPVAPDSSPVAPHNAPTAPADACEREEEKQGLTISLPLEGLSGDPLDRLTHIIQGKATLIKKALCADRLDVQAKDGNVSFHWWDKLPTPEETNTYIAFIAALCKRAKEVTRVYATDKAVESEKYAFRCFLLQLGFCGTDNKQHRKILLKRLNGNASFASKTAADNFANVQKEKRQIAKANRIAAKEAQA